MLCKGVTGGGYWLLGAAGCYALQELGRRRLLRKYWDQEAERFSPKMSSLCPLLTKLDIMPAGRIFKGPRSIFTEQAKKVNLVLNQFIDNQHMGRMDI